MPVIVNDRVWTDIQLAVGALEAENKALKTELELVRWELSEAKQGRIHSITQIVVAELPPEKIQEAAMAAAQAVYEHADAVTDVP